MPTITSNLEDLRQLLGRSIGTEELDVLLDNVKGELKGAEDENGDLRIELNDTNRPDLWCTEGIARQLRQLEKGRQDEATLGGESVHEMIVGSPGSICPTSVLCTIGKPKLAPAPSMNMDLRRRRNCRPMTYMPGASTTPPW